ncbi:MAG: ATP-binding protein [Desulfobacterales bacterium]
MFSRVKDIKPSAQHEEEFSALRQTLNFRRIWMFFVLLTTGFAVVPVIFFALIDYNLTKHSVEYEAVLRMSRIVSNRWRSVSFFLNQRKSALSFTVYDNSYKALRDSTRLSEILTNLQKGFGDFTDIGVINATGRQVAYEGPYSLEGKDYSGQDWFKRVLRQGTYVSDVFLGYRNVPHMAIAIKHTLPNESFYVLRATLEHQFTSVLPTADRMGEGDMFLVNSQGRLQTPSRYFGDVFEELPFPVPEETSQTNVVEQLVDDSVAIISYAYIPDTPYILMAVQQKDTLMAPWRETRVDLIRYVVISITVVFVWILIAISYMVRRLMQSDQRRIKYLHMLEYSNKMATIGRLAAGIAHEINNPLAIINEKAGLIKDLLTYKMQYEKDPKLISLVDSITVSVERCSRITRRLLRFARHIDVSLQCIDLKEVIQEVLGFLEKEAEYRSIKVEINVSESIPKFETDRGKLQQILLNLINNSFAAMSDGGRLVISAVLEKRNYVKIICADNGHGISEEDMKHVFEPFFSTKAKAGGGTGLGLSITYSLVKELGGDIDLKSKVNEGTTFTVTLPLRPAKEMKGYANEGFTGRR